MESERVTFRVDHSLKADIEAAAKQDGRTTSGWIGKVLSNHLKMLGQLEKSEVTETDFRTFEWKE